MIPKSSLKVIIGGEPNGIFILATSSILLSKTGTHNSEEQTSVREL